MISPKSLFILASIAVVAFGQLDAPDGMRGFVDAGGSSFTVDNSDFQDFTLQSSVPIRVRIQSIPEMIIITIDSSLCFDSTTLFFQGLPTRFLYHKYVDDLTNHDTVRTSAYGTISMKVAINRPVQITMQPRRSTLFLKEDGWYWDTKKIIGPDSLSWNSGTRTASINKDLHQTIEIGINNVTLQGNGHTLFGSSTQGLVLPYQKKRITVTNLAITGCSYGLYMKSDSCTVSNCVFTNNTYGMYVSSYSMGNVITGNTFDGNNLRYPGIALCVDVYASCQISGNYFARNNQAGLYMYKTRADAYGMVTIFSNILESNAKAVLVKGNVNGATEAIVRGNTIRNNVAGIEVSCANNVLLDSNLVSANTNGISVAKSTRTIITRNIISASSGYGLKIVGNADTACTFTTVIGNELNANGIGVDLDTNSIGTQIFQNKFENAGQNIVLDAAGSASFDGGERWGGNWWSDWQSGEPRVIDGPSFVDNYPLIGTWTGAENLSRDAGAPVTQLSIAAPSGQNGWYLGNAVVTLAGGDGSGAGIAGSYYKITRGTTASLQTYSSPFTISQEGRCELSCWSDDLFGNRENPLTTAIKIDKTRPTISRTLSGDSSGAQGWFKSVVDFRLTTADSGSRVRVVEFSMNARDTWLPYTGLTRISADGISMVSARVTDSAGNVNQLAFPIQIDMTPPVPDVNPLPEIRTLPNVAVTQRPTATDALTGPTTGTTPGQLLFLVEGTFQVTWTYRDGHGNSSTQQQTILVLSDVTPPVPDIATLPTVMGTCSAAIAAVPTATDGVSGTVYGSTQDPLSYTTQGTHIVTWTYQDALGNQSTQTQTVVVRDDVTPVPDVATLPDISGNCQVRVTSAPTATDNCAGAVVGSTTDPLFYSQPGTYMIIWRYSDGTGNQSLQTQRITVVDNIAPVPDLAALPDVVGSCMVNVSTAPTATDACAGRVTATTTAPLLYTVPGTYTIHWQYADGRGNSSSQDQTVRVTDAYPPVPDVASLPTVVGSCGVTVSTTPTATDVCVGEISGTTSDPLTYSAQGTYTIHWTYSDGRGNTATQNQTVIVADNAAPVPNVASLPTVSGSCSATISIAPTATDACVGAVTGTTTDPLTYADQGTYTVRWTYSDGRGNTSSQNQTVIVSDNLAPVPNMGTLPSISGSCSATVPAAPTATDACVGVVTGTTTDPLTYSAPGTYTVHWTYSDGRGNTATQNQTVTVADNAAPVPNIASLPTVSGSCSATISMAPTATDGCVGAITGTTTDPLTYSAPGTYTVHWTYSDGRGNASTQNQTVTVTDNAAPVPTLASLPTVSGTCSASISAAPTATDACVGVVTGTTTDPLAYSAQGTYTVHWTYSDGRGNTSTQNQTVIVSDPIAPVISGLPATQTFIIANPMGTAAALAAPTVTDNCDPSPTLTSNAPATFLPGATTVVYTATDAGGNTTQASTTVILQYAFGGFISPSDGSSYALKKIVPIAFQLLGNGGSPIGSGAICKLYYAKMSSGVPGSESLEGNCTYDSATGRYAYALTLKNGRFSTGTWQLRVALNDGTSRTVTIVVTK